MHVLQVFVYMKVQARTRLTGRKPEHEFSARPLPDPAAYSMVYPKVQRSMPSMQQMHCISGDAGMEFWVQAYGAPA